MAQPAAFHFKVEVIIEGTNIDALYNRIFNTVMKI